MEAYIALRRPVQAGRQALARRQFSSIRVRHHPMQTQNDNPREVEHRQQHVLAHDPTRRWFLSFGIRIPATDTSIYAHPENARRPERQQHLHPHAQRYVALLGVRLAVLYDDPKLKTEARDHDHRPDHERAHDPPHEMSLQDLVLVLPDHEPVGLCDGVPILQQLLPIQLPSGRGGRLQAGEPGCRPVHLPRRIIGDRGLAGGAAGGRRSLLRPEHRGLAEGATGGRGSLRRAEHRGLAEGVDSSLRRAKRHGLWLRHRASEGA
mmetsp:Transcript_166799/g.535382  ORF Transcript_166799/g.535382 Transcript_166799/m.535382 type:complete len:264 (+) Transcript_166799:418-1209(+)